MFRKRFGIAAVVVIALISTLAGPAQAGIGAAAPFRIRNDASPANTNRCIGIANNAARGAGLWECSQEGNQRWTWGDRYGTTGYYQLRNEEGRCLGVQGARTDNTAPIVGWQCEGERSPNQYWAWNGRNGYIVNFNATNKVIGTLNGRTDILGQPLILFHATGDLNQRWTVF